MMDIKYPCTLTKRNLVIKREKHYYDYFFYIGCMCIKKTQLLQVLQLHNCNTQLHIYGSREACTAILGPYENTKKMCKNKYVYNWLWRPMSFLIFFSPSKFSLCGYNLTIIRTSLKENRTFTLANTKKWCYFFFLEVNKDVFYIPIWMYTYM